MKYIEIYDEWLPKQPKPGPYFPKDIWPFIELNKYRIDNIFLFLVKQIFSRPKSIAQKFNKCNEIINKVFFVGNLMEMCEAEISKIAAMSFYSGHLSVIYETKDINFLIELASKWESNPTIEEIAPGMSKNEYKIFDQFLIKVLSEYNGFAFGFCHDGEPLLIFSKEEKIVLLKEEIEKTKKRG
jgi:hypothetical protein